MNAASPSSHQPGNTTKLRQLRLFGALFGGFILLLVASFAFSAWSRQVPPGALQSMLDTLGSLASSFAILGLLIVSFLALISFVLFYFFPAKESK
jgi:hypothetical protein